jgi:hypothetical protein
MQKSISAQSPSWAGVVGNEAGRCLFDRLAPPLRGQSPVCQREFAVVRWRMATLGDQDVFLRPRLSARYRFSQGTLAGTLATGETRRNRTLRSFEYPRLSPQLPPAHPSLPAIDTITRCGPHHVIS